MAPSTPSRHVNRYRGVSDSRIHQYRSLDGATSVETPAFPSNHGEGRNTTNIETPPSSTRKHATLNVPLAAHIGMDDHIQSTESHFVYSSNPADDGQVFEERKDSANLGIEPSPGALQQALEAICHHSSSPPASQQHPFESALYPPVFSSSPERSSVGLANWGEHMLKPRDYGKLSYSEHVVGRMRSGQDFSRVPRGEKPYLFSTSADEPHSRNVTALVTPHRRSNLGAYNQNWPAATAAAYATPSRTESATVVPLKHMGRLGEAKPSPDRRHRKKGSHATDTQRPFYEEQLVDTAGFTPSNPIITITAESKVIINDREVTDQNAQKLLPAEYCLFAGNLPIFGTADEIRAKLKIVVGPFGPVFVQIHSDAAGRPYGHLQFVTLAAKAGFFDHHMKSPVMVDGRLLRLEETTAPRSVYVRTLDGYQIDVDDVKEYLATIGGTMLDICFPDFNEVAPGAFQRADSLIVKFKNYGEYLEVRKALRDCSHRKYEFMFTPQQTTVNNRPKEKFNKSRLPCIVFVGNLDQNFASLERLHDFFRYWGGIRNIQFVQNPHCRLPNPIEIAPTHAWIDFYNHTDATRCAITANNMHFFGRRLVVQPRAHAKFPSSQMDRALNFLYCIAPSTDSVTQAPRLGFTHYGRFFPF